MQLLQSIFEGAVFIPALAFLTILAAYPLLWICSKLRCWWLVSHMTEQEDQARREALPPFERAKELIYGSERENAARELRSLKPEKVSSKVLIALAALVGLVFMGLNICTWLNIRQDLGMVLAVAIWIALMHRQDSQSKAKETHEVPGKYDVWDNGTRQGWLTLDEICLRLNRGQLSESALFYLNGERLTFEQLGISFELPQSAPAPNWAG